MKDEDDNRRKGVQPDTTLADALEEENRRRTADRAVGGPTECDNDAEAAGAVAHGGQQAAPAQAADVLSPRGSGCHGLRPAGVCDDGHTHEVQEPRDGYPLQADDGGDEGGHARTDVRWTPEVYDPQIWEKGLEFRG